MTFFETLLEKPFRIREEVVVHDKLATLRKHRARDLDWWGPLCRL
jgi:hypothetical protein